MKKNIQRIFIVLFAFMLCGNAFAQEKPNPDSDFESEIRMHYDEFPEGSPYTVWHYIGKSETVVIPKKFVGDIIDYSLFQNCENKQNIKTIVVPEGVKYIYEAFQGLTSLEKIILPKTLIEIGSYAFSGCVSLRNIEIPDKVKSIGQGAFYNCESLKNIELPDSVKEISDLAFKECINLTEFTIPSGVTHLGKLVFCNTGISTLIIQGTGLELTSLFTGAIDSRGLFKWEDNTTLKTIIFSDKCQNIEIGEAAFRNCYSVTSVIISAGVAKIGKWAFTNLKSLEQVSIAEGVTCIDEYAFSNCTGLSSIEIPSTVSIIGKSAFHSCKNLETIKISEGETALEIHEKAFCLCESLKNIHLPERLKDIGEYAFSSCTSLTKIKIPPLDTCIGYNLVASKNPFHISISIHEGAFSSCSSLEIVEFESSDNLYCLGTRVFAYCDSLKNIIIPGNVILEYNTFYDCQNLETVTFVHDLSYETACKTLYDFINNIDINTYTYFSEIGRTEALRYSYKGIYDSVISSLEFGRMSKKSFENCPKVKMISKTSSSTKTDKTKNAKKAESSEKTESAQKSSAPANAKETVKTPILTASLYEANYSDADTAKVEILSDNFQGVDSLCFKGNTGKAKQQWGYYEISSSNEKILSDLKEGNTISFSFMGDGSQYSIAFYFGDAAYAYTFRTKKDKQMQVVIPYKKLKWESFGPSGKFDMKKLSKFRIKYEFPGAERYPANKDFYLIIYDVKIE